MKYMHLIEDQDIYNWENYNDEYDWNTNVDNYINYLFPYIAYKMIITIDTNNYYLTPNIK